MDDGTQQAHKDSFKHAWNWFALHAKQRMKVTQFAILTIGGVGWFDFDLLQDHQFFLSGIDSALGVILSLGFIKIDKRTSNLVKLGEAALKFEQVRLAELTGNELIIICDLSETKKTKPQYWPSTYSEVFGLVFGSTFAGFILIGIVDCCLSQHFNWCLGFVFRHL